MKLISLVILTIVSYLAVAQDSSYHDKKMAYVETKTRLISKSISNKFKNPEKLSSSELAQIVVKSFISDKHDINQDHLEHCLEVEMRGDDERYATVYEVLRDGYATNCISQNLHPIQK